MSANELLAMLGRAWWRLLIYPGGLSAFAIAWLMSRISSLAPQTGSWLALRGSWPEISAIVLPWLGLALLPLPRVVGLSRQTDLIAVLSLLEWPLVLSIALELCSAEVCASRRAARRLAAALNGYPPLILAALVQASAAGSFTIGALARPPDEFTPPMVALLHWIGAAAWTLALPPALAIGPFAACPPTSRALRVGLRLRTIGLVALALLPWLPLIDAGPMLPLAVGLTRQPWLLSLAVWLGRQDWLATLAPLLIAAPLLALLLWGYHRATIGRSLRRWARVYLAYDVALLLVLLWVAYTALQERLV